MSDILGNKVKELENISSKITLNENQPICVRIDGKAFHTFTKGLQKPYDKRLSQAMIDTMNFLIEQTDARLGYTQSDEITLIYFKTAKYQETYFGAKLQKLNSILASMTTAKFNFEISKNIPEKANTFAFFDSRIWNVPSLKEVAELLIWRQEDAIKNSISMAAYSQFSDKILLGKKSKEKIQMLKEKGIIFEDYPDFFKTGTYAIKKHKLITMPPELKNKKGNEDKETFLRSYIYNYHLDRLKYLENIEEVLFNPIFETQKESIKERNNNKKLNK